MANKSKNNATRSQCSSVCEFISLIEEIYNKSNENYIILYRGHASVNWKLKPAIWRENNYSSINIERSMLNDFKRQYLPYISEHPNKDLDLLFLAQHYKMPTRLLDWTYNPLIALFFACNEKSEMDGIVYIKRHKGEQINKCDNDNKTSDKSRLYIGCNDNDIDPFNYFKKNTIIIPNNFNIRILNQQGVFEIFCKSSSESDFSHSIIIPKNCKEKIIKMLSHLGITE